MAAGRVAWQRSSVAACATSVLPPLTSVLPPFRTVSMQLISIQCMHTYVQEASTESNMSDVIEKIPRPHSSWQTVPAVQDGDVSQQPNWMACADCTGLLVVPRYRLYCTALNCVILYCTALYGTVVYLLSMLATTGLDPYDTLQNIQEQGLCG